MMAKAIVTGCSGFIGSHLSERLLRAGWHVVGIDRRGPGDPEAGANLAACLAHSRFTFLEDDLLEMPLRPLFAGATHVAHLAAKPGVRGGWGADFAAQYVRDNILATRAVLHACAGQGIRRFVFASTSAVYGEAPLPFREGGKALPLSPYGVTKLAAEHLVRLWGKRHQLPWVILRYFSVFGPRQRPDMAFRKMMATVRNGGEITLYGDGEQTRDFTYVGDVVQATWRALRAPAATERVINVGGGRQASMNRVLRELARLAGGSVSVRRSPRVEGEMEHTRADTRRAAKLLEWTPAVGLRAGLEREWAWLNFRDALRTEDTLPALRVAALAGGEGEQRG